MKKVLILLAVLLTANVMMAQKKDRTSAFDENRRGNYEKAAMFIEKCVNHPEFLGMNAKDQAKAWMYRGTIYTNIHSQPELADKYPDALDKAYESFKRCLEVDPTFTQDDEYAYEVYTRIGHIAQSYYENGITAFNSEAYEEAAANFRKSYDISASGVSADTSALINAALSYKNAKMYDEALVNYNELKSIGYNRVDLFRNMAACYNLKGDDATSLQMINEGLELYPGDAGMIIEKVNLYLKEGKGEEALSDLNKLHEMDPNNVSILFTLGNIFGDDSHEIFDADKAIGYYTRILEIDSTYNDANTNLAAIYLKLAYKKQAEANDITGMSKSEIQRYNDLREEANELLRTGLPYAEKLYKSQPSEENKRILKMFFGQLNMKEELNALEAE